MEVDMGKTLKKSTMLLACLIAFACIFFFAAVSSAHAASINKKSLSMTKGQSYQLSVGGKTMKWKSSSKAVKVSKTGLIKAKKSGKATITAKNGKKKYTCKVTVLSKKSAQKKANKLYKKLLSKKKIKINGKSYTGSSLKFALHDFNGDGVKDVLYGKQSFTASQSDAFKIGIYSFGKVKTYTVAGANFYKKGYASVKESSYEKAVEGYTTTATYYKQTAQFYRFDINGKRYVGENFSYYMTNDPTAPNVYEHCEEYKTGVYIVNAMINGKYTTSQAIENLPAKYGEFQLKAWYNTSYSRNAKLK